MKTFISDLIPKLQRFSQKLDNLTLLTNQHWVVIDEIINSKIIYIFRGNNELLISQNGKVEKAKWEYIGNNSILIDIKEESYLFKHGFFDENVLALKVDNKNEYAFLVNENKYNGELNTLDKIIDFLHQKYIEPQLNKNTFESYNSEGKEFSSTDIIKMELVSYETDKGMIEIEQKYKYFNPEIGQKAFANEKIALDGKYKFGFMWFVLIENGEIKKLTMF